MIARYILVSCVYCPLVTHRYHMEAAERIELVFGIKATSAYHTLCPREFGYSGTPSGTLSNTLNLAEFWATV